MKIEEAIEIVLRQMKQRLAPSTYLARKPYLHRMKELATMLGIEKPCSDLYDAFIADDNGSASRRKIHIHCVKLIDAVANTRTLDERGVLYNEPPLPSETQAAQYFDGMTYPLADNVSIAYLITKAQMELRYLNLTPSTMGQYKHAWMDIRRYFYKAVMKYPPVNPQHLEKGIHFKNNPAPLKAFRKSLNYVIAGIGHSVIRGLVTNRSMVRRELYCLASWITISNSANTVLS